MNSDKVTLELDRNEAYDILSKRGSSSELGLEDQPELYDAISRIAKFEEGETCRHINGEENDRVRIEGIIGFAGFPEYVGPGCSLIYEISYPGAENIGRELDEATEGELLKA